MNWILFVLVVPLISVVLNPTLTQRLCRYVPDFTLKKKKKFRDNNIPPFKFLLQNNTFLNLGLGVQPIPSQGGKLEIAGTVVGHWAGSRRGRGGSRGPFPLQVVSVGGPRG